MARKHRIDELLRKLYHCSDDDLLRELKQAEADIAAGKCQVPEPDPGDFDRLWVKIEAQQEQLQNRKYSKRKSH